MKLRRKMMGVVALSSLAIALAGCEDHSAEKVGKTIDQTVGKVEDVLDDATVTMKVKMALAREPDLKALQMNVNTANGVVTLEGTADSRQTSEKAAAVAQRVEGVRNVVNRLVIESANSRKGPAMRRPYWQNQVIVQRVPLAAGSLIG